MSWNNGQLYQDAVAVTPHATNGNSFMGLYVGVAGDVLVKTAKGTDVTFKAVPAGAFLPIATQLVYATSTATDIVGYRV